MKATGHATPKSIAAHSISRADKDFLEQARDLLGFIRVENAILMEDGDLSLTGLYIQKMMRLKDLEEKVEEWAACPESGKPKLERGLNLLANIQKELQQNAGQHLAALSQSYARKEKQAQQISAHDDERVNPCH